MPVREAEAAEERPRGKERRWLIVVMLLALPLLLIPLVPLVQPVTLELAGYVLLARVTTGTPPAGAAMRSGFSRMTIPNPRMLMTTEGRFYRASGPVQYGSVRLGAWAYGVFWFQGQRTVRPGNWPGVARRRGARPGSLPGPGRAPGME